ncbi:transcriptional regulator with XRE-family HTH domain [Crossiella equi]|uniref:Transcriptional regulator with XRE-family HTH domain n=1 Tax=Crossiella equi TaxID=130796 RepID=A0ABS5ACS9_9PSEU|nr:helix-turn-helix transcriptional regulator [Crossiella equi]MBP2474394.1 transcriptional regulator with XRE-family HTH domain [Crossiella equi]
MGIVSGYVLKLARESVPLSQSALAELLGVDLTTVQGWESGRRPLTAIRTADLIRLRAKLIRLGVPTKVLAALDDALEADLLIGHAVEAGDHSDGGEDHPLAQSVHRRDLTNMITWPFTGLAPPSLRALDRQAHHRRGPVPDRPVLSAEESGRFFDHLLVTADAEAGVEDNALQRRQAVYLLGFDERPDTAEWLGTEQRRALRRAGRTDHVPSWVEVRSSAIALTRYGDRDPLRAFVRTALTNEAQEIANLNYWAYWVGEVSDVQTDDGFMTELGMRAWDGEELLRHLLLRLQPGSDHAELNIHSLWSLVLARPALLEGNPALRALARERVDRMAEDAELAKQAHRELTGLDYAIRLAAR